MSIFRESTRSITRWVKTFLYSLLISYYEVDFAIFLTGRTIFHGVKFQRNCASSASSRITWCGILLGDGLVPIHLLPRSSLLLFVLNVGGKLPSWPFLYEIFVSRPFESIIFVGLSIHMLVSQYNLLWINEESNRSCNSTYKIRCPKRN